MFLYLELNQSLIISQTSFTLSIFLCLFGSTVPAGAETTPLFALHLQQAASALSTCPNISPKLISPAHEGAWNRVVSGKGHFVCLLRDFGSPPPPPPHESVHGPERDTIKTPNFLLQSWPCPFRCLASTQAQLRRLSLYGRHFVFSCKGLILLSPQGQRLGGCRESTPLWAPSPLPI